jgi:hypothetical protein
MESPANANVTPIPGQDPGSIAPVQGEALPQPWFHDDSGSLRFRVRLPSGLTIGASLSRQALHYRFQARVDGSDAVATYEAHREEIDAAVLRRVSGGSIEPVMLREYDLPRDQSVYRSGP